MKSWQCVDERAMSLVQQFTYTNYNIHASCPSCNERKFLMTWWIRLQYHCVCETHGESCANNMCRAHYYITHKNTNIVSPGSLAAPRTWHTQVHVARLPRHVAKNVTRRLMSVPLNVFIFTISFVHLRTFRTKWFFGLLFRRVYAWVSVWYIIRANGMRNVI